VGRARAVVAPDVSHDAVTIPEIIFQELWLKPNEPVLLARPDGAGTFVAALPSAAPSPVFRLSPRAFAALGFGEREVNECIVHRPITPAARAEARRLLAGDPGPVVVTPQQSSWLDAGSDRRVIRALVAAAWSGTPARLESPLGILVGGTGCVDFVEPETSSRSEPEWRQVPEKS
jgi:hypothetical protein